MSNSFFSTMKKHLADVKTYQPGKPIEEVEREYGLKQAIKMASNENPLGPSPKALKAAKRALLKVHRYPDGGCYYLRQKLAKHLSVAQDQLIFGNGSDEVLVMAVRAFVQRLDQVILADPTFLVYEIASQVEHASIVKVPMKNFRYDLESMKQAICPKTRVVFIANPDNPVGTYVNERELLNFLNSVPRNVLVVLDEAYYEFAQTQSDYPRSIKLVKKYPNLLITRTFSKAYGLAGFRIGYGIADPSVIRALEKLREPFNVNLVAQEAAIAALDDVVFLKKSVRLVEEGRQYLAKELKALGFNPIPSATNFVLTDTGQDAQTLNQILLKQGMIVRPMSAWGLKSFIRITVGKPAENKKLIYLLKQEVLKDKSRFKKKLNE